MGACGSIARRPHRGLKTFHKAGIFTWVSLEPVLDVEASLAIVKRTHEFVDLYKIGRVNYLPATKTTDWKGYTERMVELLTRLGAAATSSVTFSRTYLMVTITRCVYSSTMEERNDGETKALEPSEASEGLADNYG